MNGFNNFSPEKYFYSSSDCNKSGDKMGSDEGDLLDVSAALATGRSRGDLSSVPCGRCLYRRHHHRRHPHRSSGSGSLCSADVVITKRNDGDHAIRKGSLNLGKMPTSTVEFPENCVSSNAIDKECGRGTVKCIKGYLSCGGFCANENDLPTSSKLMSMSSLSNRCTTSKCQQRCIEEYSAPRQEEIHDCLSPINVSPSSRGKLIQHRQHDSCVKKSAHKNNLQLPTIDTHINLLSTLRVIFSLKRLKMFTVLLQLFLVPIILSSVFPACFATKVMDSSQSPPSSVASSLSSILQNMSSGEDPNNFGGTQIPRTHHRFDIQRPTNNQWMGVTQTEFSQDGNLLEDSSSPQSSVWDAEKKKVDTTINTNKKGDHDSNAESAALSQRQKSWRASNGAPLVRAHSTGFISPMNDDSVSAHGGGLLSSAGALVGGNAMMLTPQLVGLSGAEDASSRLLKVGPCLCWNTTDDGLKREVECKCTGQEMTSVTGSLPSDIHRLTVEQAANFTTLGNEDLKPYRSSLTELVLSELPSFQTLRNGTFLGMRKLNTIYIHGSPALTQIPDSVFTVYLPDLKLIRITHSSLEVMPNFSQLHIKADAALHMVELENNKISRMIPGSFKGLVTEHLALSYNNLEEIGPSAFEGSTIARLTLKGNPLKTLHSNSFVGIDSLRVLDLSETQITYLPTQGLSGLESLRLEKVWTLSVIPSIYHFQVLEEAWLTWPYHCCAFEYPETHDPAAFQRYKEYVRSVVNELCAKASAKTSTELPENATNKNGDDGDGAGSGFTGDNSGSKNELNASVATQRQKRHLRLSDKRSNTPSRGFRSTTGPYGRSNSASSETGIMGSVNGNPGGGRRVMPHQNNENTQVHSSNSVHRFATRNGKVVSKREIINEPLVTSSRMTTSNPPSHSSMSSSSSPLRLRKRSLNGHHPRLALAQHKSSNNGGNGSGSTEGSIKTERNEDGKTDGVGGGGSSSSSTDVLWDGFHHPHVHGSSGVNSGNSPNQHPHHPFDSDDDDSTLHYGKIGTSDAFDPFVFDPDQSFAPLEPHDLERESDILGKDPWGMFGHHSNEAGFDEDIGVFHPSVTPSPTVISLCGNVSVKKPPKIACHPLPDAFNPCEDIMGSIWLRGAVWVVVALALFGNTAVLVVLLLAPGRISVQRFLMANLSWADLCMGIYLLMVATQDLVSLGSYFNYAIDWQLGWGCQIAGFLTVFASELSVFTLAVITGERWYALTRAIHLTKRLTLLGASQLMALGWFMAILLAALPLMGVSSYSKTSICLPMEASSGGAVAYLVFLLLFNGVAFFLVACAYWQMYRAVAGHGHSGGGGGASPAAAADTAIAKKMALLVFTDFACWAPVAFFGLTAVGGMPLIGVTDSKILLVFFYPLNACCNPYLYAILTKQYRRDLLLLLSRHGICTKRAARFKTGVHSTNNTMQTMQTVLRMGSMTETKVAGGGGSGRGSVLNGGRASSIAATGPILEDEALLVSVADQKSKTRGNMNGDRLSPIIPSSSSSSSPNKLSKNNLHQLETNILNHPTDSLLKSSSEDLRKALNLQPPSPDEDEDDDVFDLNGLSGRHLAETTFINVPLTSSSTSGNGGGGGNKFGSSDPAKEKLIRGTEHNNSKLVNSSASPSRAPVEEKIAISKENSWKLW